VKVSPDGKVLYVANQGRHGVSLVDPGTMTETGFIRTGTGAHGLNVSRDATTLFVSNRMEGTISVIDFATQTVRESGRSVAAPT
jgi:YVTN family beta-propeller protein